MTAEGQQMTMIRSMRDGVVTMWSSMQPGMAMRVDTDRSMRLEGERTGRRDTVNGEACEIWIASNGEVCVTDDGIPIRSSGKGTTATMVDLQRTAQDAGLFEPPAGMQVMTLPQIPGGAMPGPKLPF